MSPAKKSKANSLCVLTGNANRELAQEICDTLDIPLSGAEIRRFSDGEIWVSIKDNVRGKDVFIIQPTSNPVNEHLMELLIMIDAARRASAQRITAVIPYYGYARQDRKDKPRVSITAKLVANMLTAAGTSRVLTIDLHAGQIQGFFDIPLDHLYGSIVLIDAIRALKLKNLVVVAPDAGSAKRCRAFATILKTSLAIVDKRRPEANEVRVEDIVGDVKGHNVIIVDDMIDTAGTLVMAADALADKGAKEIYACCTHAVFSGRAMERIDRSRIAQVIVTNTIRIPGYLSPKIRVVSIAGLLARAIANIHKESSVSKLFPTPDANPKARLMA